MTVSEKVKERFDELVSTLKFFKLPHNSTNVKLTVLKNLRDMYNIGYEDGKNGINKNEINIEL